MCTATFRKCGRGLRNAQDLTRVDSVSGGVIEGSDVLSVV